MKSLVLLVTKPSQPSLLTLSSYLLFLLFAVTYNPIIAKFYLIKVVV